MTSNALSGVGQESTVDEVLDDLFTYHAPTPEQAEKYKAINEAAKEFARVVLDSCPRNPDRSAAIRKIREARMTANSAIATKTGGAHSAIW